MFQGQYGIYFIAYRRTDTETDDRQFCERGMESFFTTLKHEVCPAFEKPREKPMSPAVESPSTPVCSLYHRDLQLSSLP